VNRPDRQPTLPSPPHIKDKNTMKHTLITSAVLATLLLGACASTPPPPPALVDARASLKSAELNPAVLTHAPMELKKATDSLNRANQMQDKGEPPAAVNSAAYVAQQQVKTAVAVAQAKTNDLAITGSDAERERARADMRTLEAQRAQTQTQIARQQTAVAVASASSAQAQSAQLQKQLADLQATQTERGMLVTLGDVLFEFGRADVKPGAQASLRKLADFLQQNPNRRILVEGHTDSVGSADANNLLSRKRADAVDTALVAMGLDAARATTVGYGEDFPVTDNLSDTNRALNRRVEVYISDSDQPVRPRR
jgi:outer membrane protein OmpA-like peptidoglycan-associated protein